MEEPVIICPPDATLPCGANGLQERPTVQNCENPTIFFSDIGAGVSTFVSQLIQTTESTTLSSETLLGICGPITDVNVSFSLRNDLLLPDGTVINAVLAHDGVAVNLMRDVRLPTAAPAAYLTNFTDSAVDSIDDAIILQTGIYRPTSDQSDPPCPPLFPISINLSSFVGTSASGPWVLSVCMSTPGEENPEYDVTVGFTASVTSLCGRSFTRVWGAVGCETENQLRCEQSIVVESAPEPEIANLPESVTVKCSSGQVEEEYGFWRADVLSGPVVSNHAGQAETRLFNYIPEVHDVFTFPPALNVECDNLNVSALRFQASNNSGNIVTNFLGGALYWLLAANDPKKVSFLFDMQSRSKICVSKIKFNYYLAGLLNPTGTIPVSLYANDVLLAQLYLGNQTDVAGMLAEFNLNNSTCGGYLLNGSLDNEVFVTFRLEADFSSAFSDPDVGFSFAISSGGDGGTLGLEVTGMCDCVSPCCYIDNSAEGANNVTVELTSFPSPLPQQWDNRICKYTATYTITLPCPCKEVNTIQIVRTFAVDNDTFNIEVPEPLTLSCTQDTQPNPDGPPGFVMVTSCLDWDYNSNDEVQPGDCSAQYSILRTWNAFDACGNEKSDTQTIYVRDDTLAITAPADITIQCTQSTTPTITGTPTLTDACISPDELSYTYADETSVVCEGAVYQITRTFTASNGCSLTEPRTATQHISVVDDTLAITAPIDVTISCTQTTEPILTGNPTVTDECVGPEGLTTTFEDQVSVQCAGAIYDIERTWTAANVCAGVTRSDTQHIHVEDNTLIINIPEDTTLPCTADTSPHGPAGHATASDACTSVKVTYHDTLVTAGVECPVLYQIRRQWTATNACGQTKTGLQVITVTNVGRLRICCPPDAVLSYADSSDPIFTGEPSVFHPCACLLPPKVYFPIAVSYVDSPPQCVEQLLPPHNGCAEYFVRTWTAKDRCGESVSCAQRITRLCNAPPIVACPPDVTVAVDAYPPPPANLSARCGCHLTAPECGCRDNAITVTSSLHVLSTYECIKGHPVRHAVRIYEAEDNCGNKTRCVQNIYVPDAHASATKKRFPDCNRQP